MSQIAQTFRYSITAGICLLLCMTLIPLFNFWGLHYVLATCLAFCIICVVGFFLHCFWTFGVESNFKSFVRYVSTMAINLPLTIAIIAIGHDFASLSVAVSTALASMILFIWNYLSIRWAVARNSRRTLR